MTKSYYKPPTRIVQAEIIPFLERTKLYQKIHENLLELERLNSRGPAYIKRYIDICIDDETREQAEQEYKCAEIIQFKGEVLND